MCPCIFPAKTRSALQLGNLQGLTSCPNPEVIPHSQELTPHLFPLLETPGSLAQRLVFLMKSRATTLMPHSSWVENEFWRTGLTS